MEPDFNTLILNNFGTNENIHNILPLMIVSSFMCR